MKTFKEFIGLQEAVEKVHSVTFPNKEEMQKGLEVLNDVFGKYSMSFYIKDSAILFHKKEDSDSFASYLSDDGIKYKTKLVAKE